MKHLKLTDNTSYDGSQIEPLWAFRTFGLKDSSIVSWIGPMEIHPDHLIDFEDVGLEIKGLPLEEVPNGIVVPLAGLYC